MEPCYVLLTIQTYPLKEWRKSEHTSDKIITLWAVNLSIMNDTKDYSAKPGLSETQQHMYHE
jgi:hypothetical protein